MNPKVRSTITDKIQTVNTDILFQKGFRGNLVFVDFQFVDQKCLDFFFNLFSFHMITIVLFVSLFFPADHDAVSPTQEIMDRLHLQTGSFNRLPHGFRMVHLAVAIGDGREIETR